jgi:N6-L-threonylcarbamoyladenine synthase
VASGRETENPKSQNPIPKSENLQISKFPNLQIPPPQFISDLAASFQEAVVDCLVVKAVSALERTGSGTLCVGGGVAANAHLRERLGQESQRRGFRLHIAPPRLCTDNAAMGAIAVERLRAGLVEPLDLDAVPGLVREAG